jgi:MtN3 and saliva related transmembrane protein
MNDYEVIGLIGMMCMVMALYPQLYRIYKRKSSEDLSLLLSSILLIGSCFLIIYAFIIDSLTYKLLEILFAIHVIILLIFTIKYRKKPTKD